MIFHKADSLKGCVTVPGDKSISHRAVMFGSLAQGSTRITHFLKGADCLSTIGCFRSLGVPIDESDQEIIVHGRGLHGLSKPEQVLDAGNSGTTTRLISGILAGQPFETTLTGDASLRSRPMKRIITPLSAMGADIQSVKNNGCVPLKISPAPLHGIHYYSPVASAQVKSCVLLAGMYADSPTSVTEPVLSRNHSELMLRAFGAKITSVNRAGEKDPRATATIEPEPHLTAQDIEVPGDISSAAYFIAAASIVPNSEVLLKGVGINPTRDGMIRVCRMMGASLELINRRECAGEPVADILVRSSCLHGCTVAGEIIPALIDEIPVIAVMAAFAEGTTTIADAAELKVKESDRIAVMTENLSRMGVDITPTDDGMIIRGGHPVHGAQVDPHLDHRIAMSFAVASLAADGDTRIKDADCVGISYPEFYRDLAALHR